jgi:hypothetical protein
VIASVAGSLGLCKLEFFGFLVRLAIGASVFVALMYFALRTMSQFWRATAEAYPGRAGSQRIARKFPETIVMTSRTDDRGADRFRKGWHSYAPARIDIHEDGLVLAMIPPFDLMCAPLFLPFSEMTMADTSWAFWRQPVAIRMRQAPGIDIIIGREAAGWIRNKMDSAAAAPNSRD